MDKFEWFVVFVLLTLAFGTVVASLLWRQRLRQPPELAQARLSLGCQRLAALCGQLEPHFIFNTLSAIGAMVRTDDKPVALAGLERLGERLRVRIEGAQLLDDGVACRPMLQPLVENALRHDLECHDDASDIVVTFNRTGTLLLVRVTNTVREHAAPQAGLGIGPRGIRARLQLRIATPRHW